MPLSDEQVQKLKDGTTKIEYQGENPKVPGSKAWDRSEKYKAAKTVMEAKELKASWQDMTSDFDKGFLKFVTSEMEVDHVSSKRGPQEGTPDREALARSKAAARSSEEEKFELSKVEMSAATIQTLRMMLREELTNTMENFEESISSRMGALVDDLRADLVEEKKKRQELEERVRKLEEAHDHGDLAQRIAALETQVIGRSFQDDVEEVDKSMVVIGRFSDKTMEEAEEAVRDLMKHVVGFKDVEVTAGEPPVAFAHFNTPMQAMKFIRGQKKNPDMHSRKLWASENRSASERRRCKTVSKLKKFLIEIGNFDPRSVAVNYKAFKVSARVDGKQVLVASLPASGDIMWTDHEIVTQDVRDAMEHFIAEFE